MTKQLSSKELGIPSGYRLSESNINNLVTVATRQLFSSDMLKHVKKEAEIFNLIMDELYPDNLFSELDKLSRKFTRNPSNVNSGTTNYQSSLELMVGPDESKIGCRNYYFNNASIKNGIADSQEFRKLMDELSVLRLKELGIDVADKRSNIKQLIDLWFNRKYPFSDTLTVSNSNIMTTLTPNLRKKVKRFLASREVLSGKIDEKRLLIKSIAHAYTSAVKLCNDAPEFVEYINDSNIYNKDGKKCTDMSTIDMIQQLRKL